MALVAAWVLGISSFFVLRLLCFESKMFGRARGVAGPGGDRLYEVDSGVAESIGG